MNPETHKLELVDPDLFEEKIVGAAPRDVRRELKRLESMFGTAVQQSEPHKSRWTTFTIGELVYVEQEHNGMPRGSQQVKVKNIHADGLLLGGAHLNLSFSAGQNVFVKDEKCIVKHISSKGMYVEGTS